MAELLQEKYGNKDPWRILVICMLLNQTTGATAEPTLQLLFKAWPTAASMAKANVETLELAIDRLGFGHKRARYIMQLSRAWNVLELSGRNMALIDPEQFLGCGRYAKEAWDMFVLGKRDFIPQDKELRRRMYELRTK